MGATKVITAAGVALAVAGAGAVWLVARRESPPVPVPAPPAFATVTVHGRDGTFGSLGPTTPSGQPAARAAVSGWDFAPGVQAYRSALAADGTLLVAGAAQTFDFSAATADRVTVAAYRPESAEFATVQIGPVGPGAPSVSDLAPVDGGVAFVTRPAPGAASDRWPAFGVLTTVEGRWRVAPVRGAVSGADFGGLATLPRSRHVLVARAGRPGEANGGLLALRLRGPDQDGRFTAEVTGEYPYPEIGDGQVTVREVRVDPTARGGDERFAAGLDVYRGKGQHPHRLVQEFRYDAAAGRIVPVSAPLVAGDRNGDDGKGAFFEYLSFLYDRAGNLWVSRSDGLGGGPLAVYTAGEGRRRLEGECRFRPDRPPRELRTAAGGASVWGQACPPDYDVLQARHRLAIIGLAQDPASGDIVALVLGGTVLTVRAVPSGGGLEFRVGNPVDLGRKLLPIMDGDPWHALGPVDRAHRVWITGMQAAKGGQAGRHQDQWLYSVDLGDLFDPAPVVLPQTPGRSVTIQAERSSTVTATVRPGRRAAAREVVSDVTVQDCVAWAGGTTCGYDETAGDGFLIADESRYGMLRGAVDYRVDVPTAGEYRVSYRAATFAVTKGARIALSAGGHTYVRAVSTDGHWQTVRAGEPIALPAGRQTIRLSVPEGRGGWFLNSFTLQRA